MKLKTCINILLLLFVAGCGIFDSPPPSLRVAPPVIEIGPGNSNTFTISNSIYADPVNWAIDYIPLSGLTISPLQGRTGTQPTTITVSIANSRLKEFRAIEEFKVYITGSNGGIAAVLVRIMPEEGAVVADAGEPVIPPPATSAPLPLPPPQPQSQLPPGVLSSITRENFRFDLLCVTRVSDTALVILLQVENLALVDRNLSIRAGTRIFSQKNDVFYADRARIANQTSGLSRRSSATLSLVPGNSPEVELFFDDGVSPDATHLTSIELHLSTGSTSFTANFRDRLPIE